MCKETSSKILRLCHRIPTCPELPVGLVDTLAEKGVQDQAPRDKGRAMGKQDLCRAQEMCLTHSLWPNRETFLLGSYGCT